MLQVLDASGQRDGEIKLSLVQRRPQVGRELGVVLIVPCPAVPVSGPPMFPINIDAMEFSFSH